MASVWCGASLSTQVLEFGASEMNEIFLVGVFILIKLTSFAFIQNL